MSKSAEIRLFSVANKDSLTKAIERTIYSGLITRSNVKMHTPRHYPLPRRLTLRKARSITRFPLSIRHFKSGVGNKLRSCGCSFVRRRQRRSCVLRCGIRRQECVGRRGSCRFRWVCRRCRGFGCGGIRFSETDAETEEITEASEALSESEESTENAVSLSENKNQNACHGNLFGIGIYRFGRRNMLYCVLCKETPQKRRKRKIC